MAGRRGSTSLAFPKDHPQGAEVADALARVEAAETLVDLYDAWLKLRIAQASAAAQRAREAERLDLRAGHVLRSVESARALQVAEPPAPADAGAIDKADPYAEYLANAEREIGRARKLLDGRNRREEAFFAGEIQRIKSLLRGRAEATLAVHRPAIVVHVQPVPPDRCLVHLERPAEEDSVLLGFVLTGALFTRYDAFFDDAVDDVMLEPARFYAEEGLDRGRGGSVDEEDAFCAEAGRRFLPVKGMIPVRVPGHDFPRFRIQNRGPMSEVLARREGAGYELLMARADAELLSGYLISLKVAGRLDVTLKV